LYDTNSLKKGNKMNTDELRKYREVIASRVHDAWWETKITNGFHAPVDCPSCGVKAAKQHEIKSLDFYQFPERFKFCALCHPDMYPYESLPEDIKDYDRITVDTVLKAISELSQGGE